MNRILFLAAIGLLVKTLSSGNAHSERHCERLRLSFSIGAEISVVLAKAYAEAILGIL
ncbi:hypothetical protein ACV07N_11290 [Roseivirga echinicomitans]